MQKTIITLVDDIDGSELGVQTVRFGLDGQQYEIDVCRDHAEGLRSLVALYAGHGRKAAARRPAGGRRSQADRDRSAAVRQWANDHGHGLGDRGRIPGHVTKAANDAGVGL